MNKQQAATFATLKAALESGDAGVIEAASEEARWYAAHPTASYRELLGAPFTETPVNVLGRAGEIYEALLDLPRSAHQ
jgi:hypothetical protein